MKKTDLSAQNNSITSFSGAQALYLTIPNRPCHVPSEHKGLIPSLLNHFPLLLLNQHDKAHKCWDTQKHLH